MREEIYFGNAYLYKVKKPTKKAFDYFMSETDGLFDNVQFVDADNEVIKGQSVVCLIPDNWFRVEDLLPYSYKTSIKEMFYDRDKEEVVYIPRKCLVLCSEEVKHFKGKEKLHYKLCEAYFRDTGDAIESEGYHECSKTMLEILKKNGVDIKLSDGEALIYYSYY